MDDKLIHKKLDDHVIRYFRHVHETIVEDTFDDQESKGLFLKNVFQEIVGDLVRLSKNWKVSRILEDVIQHFEDEIHLKGILEAACKATPLLISNQFGSHVLQQIFCHCLLSMKCVSQGSGAFSDIMKTFLDMVNSCIINSLDILIHDVYGSHVLSEVVQILGQAQVDPKISRSRVSIKYKKRFQLAQSAVSTTSHEDSTVTGVQVMEQGPVEFGKALKTLLQSLVNIPNFGELLCNQSANPVLQVSLLVSSKRFPKLCFRICDKILNKGNLVKRAETNEMKPSSNLLLLDTVGSHLVEKALQVMSAEQRTLFFEDCLKENLVTLSLHGIGNFMVQTFFKACQSANMAAAAISLLCDSMPDILRSGHFQVIVQMAQCCAKFGIMQSEFMSPLRNIFSPLATQTDPAMLARRLVLLRPTGTEAERASEEINLHPKEINYHGCCLAAHLLRFQRPKRILKSLLHLRDDEMVLMSCHPHGSIVMEALCQSSSIKLETKLKLMSLFTDNLKGIACDKFGSHVFDKFWAQLDHGNKEILIQRLVSSEAVLKKSFFGKFALKNCNVNMYQHDKDSWIDMQRIPATSAGKQKQVERNEIAEPANGKRKSRKKKSTSSQDIDNDELKVSVETGEQACIDNKRAKRRKRANAAQVD